MHKKFTKKWMILLGILAITSVACSCGLLENIVGRLPVDLGDLTDNAEQVSTLVAEQVPELATQAAGAIEQATEMIPEQNAEPSDLGNIASDLENLASYRIEMLMRVEGSKQDGSEIRESLRMLQEVLKESSTNHFRLEQSDELAQTSEVVEFYSVGSDYYMLDPNNEFGSDMPCLAFSGGSIDQEFADMQFLKPQDLFNDVEGGELVEKGVEINGIKTDHYRVNNVSLSDASFKPDNGDIWIAQDGNYVVKFVGDGTGETTSFVNGEILQGSIHWEYELKDINQVAEITIPESCLQASQSGINDIPVPANATEVGSFGTIMSFSSPDSPDMVAEFYRQEMPAAGFNLVEDSSFSGIYMFTFTRDNENLSIMITEGDNGGSSAVITAEIP